ncbi:MAG TPA: hypothetical protein VJ944_01520 [Thermoplasmataceae archaeon]|nr:hypothetical protein [Thermoplasmataceae archaeon]
MTIRTTMTGSYFRTPEIEELLKKSPTGEISDEHREIIEKAERRAIRDQLHPGGIERGLTWISNGEQRKSGYTTYIPNRFSGFSKTEKIISQIGDDFFNELQESNPPLAQAFAGGSPFAFDKIEDKLQYTGEKLAKKEAEDFVKLAKEEGAERIFLNAPSPGILTLFYTGKGVYKDHNEFLFDLSKELAKEYRAILSVDGVDLQIDAPDIGVGSIFKDPWGFEFNDALPYHVEAINEAIAGLPQDRVRVHYCYGNYSGAHTIDPHYGNILPELVKLKAGTLVGEMANPRHAGDPLIIRNYAREHGWPKQLNIAAGVIDVKTPFVESPEAVALKLKSLAEIDEIGPERVLGGTDCGFETFSWQDNITYQVAVKKLRSLAEGAALV